MSKEILYGLGGIIIGLIIGVLLAQNAVNYNQTGLMGMRFQNSSNTSSTMDSHFIEQMIPHHEDAITMAKLALEKAKREENILLKGQVDELSRQMKYMKEQFYNEIMEEILQKMSHRNLDLKGNLSSSKSSKNDVMDLPLLNSS